MTMPTYMRQTDNYVWSPESDRIGHGATSTVYQCRDKVRLFLILLNSGKSCKIEYCKI